jgi:hypothetical protein
MTRSYGFAACTISKVWPATVTCPVRLVPVFATIRNETIPGPLRFPPGGSTIHGESLFAIHGHPAAVATVATAIPSAALNDLGATVTV